MKKYTLLMRWHRMQTTSLNSEWRIYNIHTINHSLLSLSSSLFIDARTYTLHVQTLLFICRSTFIGNPNFKNRLLQFLVYLQSLFEEVVVLFVAFSCKHASQAEPEVWLGQRVCWPFQHRPLIEPLP